jgi:hypothetical protein
MTPGMDWLLEQNEKLKDENAELRKLNADMASVLAHGVRTRNTDMVMGAVLSGGDVMALAKRLAESK